jgi:hypothetical protein
VPAIVRSSAFGQPAEIPGQEQGFRDLVGALARRSPAVLVILREHPKSPELRTAHRAALEAAGLDAVDATGLDPIEPWLAACDLVTTCFSHCAMDYAVLDAASGAEFATLRGHAGSVLSVAFSPDGRRVASGSWGEVVRDGDDVSRLLGRAAEAEARRRYHDASRRSAAHRSLLHRRGAPRPGADAARGTVSAPRVLGLVAARGGSVGLPRKNVLPLCGKPLIVHTIEAAHAARTLTRTILSSDDAEIIAIARDAGCAVPFVRPAELAGDRSSTVDVTLHALDWLERHEEWRAEVVVMPPATGAAARASTSTARQAVARTRGDRRECGDRSHYRRTDARSTRDDSADLSEATPTTGSSCPEPIARTAASTRST